MALRLNRLPASTFLSRSPLGVGWILLVLLAAPLGAAPDAESFRFQEVYDLLKANLAGTSETELNRAAVRGLLEQLSGKVSVVGEASRLPAGATNGGSVSASVLDGKFAYLRLTRLTAETDGQFESTLRQMRATNSLKGLILDLRYTEGQDYGAAVAIADRFLTTEQPLVDWGEGWKKSTPKTDALNFPLTILVNRRTTGAAEVLAGILRYRDVGLLIGTNTAGQASMAKEFSLKTGQRLRVAIAPVKVADGRELPFTGIQADIQVDVSPDDELAWYSDAFKVLTKTGRTTAVATNDPAGSSTNLAGRRRINEAELVRMSRDGQSLDRETPLATGPARSTEPSAPLVNDPVLARALDLLKGLAVVQSARPI